MSRSRELADFASSLEFSDLTPEAVKAAKLITLDLLGVAAGAVGGRAPLVMNNYVADSASLRPGGGATVLGSALRLPPADAALANGTLAADLELDDVHPTANLHASSVFVPALLAVAETRGVSGRDWIAGLAVAYDVGCRVSLALGDTGQTDRGYHPTAISGTFGAAAGVARLLGHDGRQTDETLGLAGTQAAGLLTWRTENDHFTKSFQSGFSARSAVTAGELVALGFRGPQGSLDGRYNIFQVFTDAGQPELLTAGLGSVFEIVSTGFKFFNCCRAIHAPIELVFDLMAEHGLTEADIGAVEVLLPPSMVPVVDHNELITHDLQYAVAVGIRDGQLGQAQMSSARREDPSLTALVGRVHLGGDEGLDSLHPPQWPARVRIRTVDGRALDGAKSDPRGNPGNPASDQDLHAKFRSVTAGILEVEATELAISTISTLEDVASMSEVARLFQTRERG